MRLLHTELVLVCSWTVLSFHASPGLQPYLASSSTAVTAYILNKV